MRKCLTIDPSLMAVQSVMYFISLEDEMGIFVTIFKVINIYECDTTIMTPQVL